MKAETLRRSFPAGLTFPPELEKLCEWQEQHGYPISGDFELEADEVHDVLENWFGSAEVVDRLAVFGKGPDGSLVAVWGQKDGRCPVVHLGAEGQNNFVLAEDMQQFVRLLAVGYRELGFDDLSAAPQPIGINSAFQDWVTKTWSTTIPVIGSDIVNRAKATHDDFQGWKDHVLQRVRGS